MDHRFFHISEVGPMCDKVSVCVEIECAYVTAHEFQVILEEFPERPFAKAALEPRAVWGKKMVRLCIAHQTNDQVSGRVEELAVADVHRTWPPIVPDSIGYLVGWDLGMRLSDIKPKSVECERMFVILVG